MRNYLSLMAILLSTLLAAGGCKQKSGSVQQERQAAVVKGAVLETVRSVPVPETLDLVGTIRARTSAVVSARIPGTVSVLRVREGDRVKRGQLLARLDAQENQANAAGASAGVEEARRGLDEALSRKRLAETTLGRYQKLFNEQAVSRQEFDVKQTERELTAQGAARAEARLKQAQEGARAAGSVAGYTPESSPRSRASSPASRPTWERRSSRPSR